MSVRGGVFIGGVVERRSHHDTIDDVSVEDNDDNDIDNIDNNDDSRDNDDRS